MRSLSDWNCEYNLHIQYYGAWTEGPVGNMRGIPLNVTFPGCNPGSFLNCPQSIFTKVGTLLCSLLHPSPAQPVPVYYLCQLCHLLNWCIAKHELSLTNFCSPILRKASILVTIVLERCSLDMWLKENLLLLYTYPGRERRAKKKEHGKRFGIPSWIKTARIKGSGRYPKKCAAHSAEVRIEYIDMLD